MSESVGVLVSGSTTTLSTYGLRYLVESSGTLDVVSGGVADETTIFGTGDEVVFHGGSALSNEVDGGALVVSSGGYASNTDVIGRIVVAAGGTAEAGIIEGGGSLTVEAGGTALSVETYGGSETVQSGGQDSGALVESGTLIVASGGTGTNETATPNGAVLIEAGGLAVATTSQGGPGSASGVTLLSGGNMVVRSGGEAIATIVSAGGRMTVSAGGTETGGHLLSGGSEMVLSSGTADATGVFGGGTLGIASDGLVSAASVSGLVIVGSGGQAEAVAVLAHGAVLVSSGGTASGMIVIGGTETVLAGGQDSAGFVSGGLLAVSSGGSAFNTVVQGVSAAAIIGSGGVESVTAFGTATDVMLSGGRMVVGSQGVALGAAVESGGTVNVGAGGSALDVMLIAGGNMTVQSGGIAVDPVGSAGGVTTIASGGEVITELGGGATVSGAAVNAAAVVLQSGASMIVAPNTIAGSLTVESGATLTVDNGGTAAVVHLEAGGVLDITSGGVVEGVVVSSGAGLVLGNGASALLPVVSGGGYLEVSGGGFAQDIAVGQGGLAVVAAGGTMDLGFVSGVGAGLLLETGADVVGGIGFGGYGGVIAIDGSAPPDVPIGGIGAGNIIALPGIPYDPAGSVSSAGSVLTLSENGQTYSFNLVSANIGASPIDLVPISGGGTDIYVACFAAGTRLATPAGAVPVEALAAGDAVLAWQDGAWRPARVRWVGRTTIDLARHPQPDKAAPIRILAGAVAEGVPARDLLLSPDHAVFLDGVLIQAQALQNGATVAQEFPDRVTYCHVELDRHAILCADGLPAESYLDTGNRALFAGEAGARPLHPDLIAAAWAEHGCAPLHLTGAAVAAAHARLVLRAASLGHALVADPGLRILADGREVLGFVQRNVWQATLPAGTRELRLRSRSFIPAWFAEDDRRRLGVAVASLRLIGRKLPPSAYGAGWHAPERAWRWTDGDAALHLRPLRRPAQLALTLATAGARYWAVPSALPRAPSMPYLRSFS